MQNPILEAQQLAKQNDITLPVTVQAAYFLRKVWQIMPDDHMLGLQANGDFHRPYWLYGRHIREAEFEGAIKWASFLNRDNYNIYFNCVSRQDVVKQRSKHAKGTYSELRASSLIWADIDTVKDNISISTAFDKLMQFKLKPSIVTFTGGGIQAFWRLNELWDISTEAQARDFSQWMVGYLHPQFTQHNFTFDPAAKDTTREMRLPGFINTKKSRNGAIAHIIYDSDDTYFIPQLKEYSLPPEPKRSVFYPVEKPEKVNSDQYYITGYMARFFFNGEIPDKGTRHDTARNLSLQAAICGIPFDLWLNHLQALVSTWFSRNEQWANDTENTESGALWAYDQASESGQADTVEGLLALGVTLENAVLSCIITETEFKRLETEDLEKATEKVTEIDQTVIESEPVDLPDRFTVPAIREHIKEKLELYTAGFAPDNSPANTNSVLLLKTPPGSGKTHASANLLNATPEPSAFLSLFKLDQQTGQETFNHFGVDTSQTIFIEARNPNEQSPGYCHYTRQAERLGNKGENIVKSLCYFCEHKIECEAKHYLSQFQRTGQYKIMVARHNHGKIRSIVQNRNIIVFDENPLDVVAEPVKVKLADIRLPKLSQLTKLEYENELAIIERVLMALKATLENNFPIGATVYPSPQVVKLGGRWLMDNLVNRLGVVTLEQFISYSSIGKKAMNSLTSGYRTDNSLEAIDANPPNFLKRFREIVAYEYNNFYRKNCQRWNSRLIPYGQDLHIYEMQPFKLDKNVKIIVNDATSLQEYYGLAFTDIYGNARQTYVVEPMLYPNAVITQYTGNDNSKSSSVRAIRSVKSKLDTKIPDNENKPLLGADIMLEGIYNESNTLYEMVENQKNFEQLIKDPALNRCQAMITNLAAKHKGSLLVVTYREFAIFLKQWAKQTGVINPEYIQWFGNLKGKNDYENLESCLIFGTPRVQIVDLLIMAQIWNYKDPEPINYEQKMRVLPFDGYLAPDGKKRARQYNGFTDERLNKLYVHLIQSEIRQCYERIRPDSSATKKFVYLDTAFPVAPYLTELIDRKNQMVRETGEKIFNAMLTQEGKVYRAKFAGELKKMTGCGDQTAQAVYDMICKIRLGIDLQIGMVEVKENPPS